MLTRNRMPDYVAEAPLQILLTLMQLDAADPRDVLLGAVYKLAADLERRTAPWDAEGLALVGAEHLTYLSAGPAAVHLQARVVGGAR